MANEVFDSSIQSLQISTGNVFTVNDPFLSSIGAAPGGNLNNGARNPLGMAGYISDGTSTGRRWKVRYVRVNATTFNPSPIIGPVFWKDNTFQVVTTLASESFGGALNFIAGVMLNVNITNGNYGFILVFGHIGAANTPALTGIPVPASTAAGDLLVGAAGQQTFARVAANANRTNVEIGIAETAISGGNADVFVNIEQ